jgi:hypothetical protein
MELPRSRVELGNVCCSDFDHLYREIIRAKERLQHKKEIIISCARQCGYLVSFLLTRSVSLAECVSSGSCAEISCFLPSLVRTSEACPALLRVFQMQKAYAR